MSISLVVNGIAHTVDVEPETPLLWVLRENGALVAVIYVTHYRQDRIWQQNVVLEWTEGETNAPNMRCDFAEFYPIGQLDAQAEAASVGFQPHPITIRYEPTEYLCFLKTAAS